MCLIHRYIIVYVGLYLKPISLYPLYINIIANGISEFPDIFTYNMVPEPVACGTAVT
jgi:hypothetical protein